MTGVQYKYFVATTAVAALVMDLLDLTIMNVALPAIQREFDVSRSALSLAVTAYLATLAVVMPASGWATRRFGAPRAFLFAVAAFTAASALGAAAWSFEALILARGLQGLGGGLLVPVGMSMLFRAFPKDERATASAVFAVPGAFAPAIGPLLGGVLVDSASWRWVFLINLPVGVLAFLAGWRWLRPESGDSDQRLDVPGLIYAGAAVVGAVLGLTWLSEDGISGRVALAFSLGFAGLVFLLTARPHRTAPLVDLALFRRRSFAFGQFTMLVTSAGFGGLLFTVPLLLQQHEHLSATSTGLVLTAHAVGIVLVTPVGPRLVRRFGEKLVLACGIVGTAVTTSALAWLAHGADPVAYAVVLLLGGSAFGLMIVPQQTLPFVDLDDDQIPDGTSLLSTIRQLGVAIGTALVALPMAWQPGQEGFAWAFLVAGVVTLTGAIALVALRSHAGPRAAQPTQGAAS